MKRTDVRDNGQIFQCVEMVPYTRQDGSLTSFQRMRSSCAACGAAFEFIWNPRKEWRVTRRCKPCRSKDPTGFRLTRRHGCRHRAEFFTYDAPEPHQMKGS